MSAHKRVQIFLTGFKNYESRATTAYNQSGFDHRGTTKNTLVSLDAGQVTLNQG